MDKLNKKAFDLSIEESKSNAVNNYKNGGPFGAVIVKNEQIIATAHNTVVASHDATAHAEINAIRKASKVLNTHDLSDCVLYTSAEPCPMCLGAIIWANIKKVYYANTRKDSAKIGFRDDIIYEYLYGHNQDIIEVHHIQSEEALKVFDAFMEIQDKNMY